MDARTAAYGFSVVILLAYAAAEDIRAQRIPNRLTFPAMALAIVFGAAWDGLQGLLFSLEGIAVGVGTLLVPYLLGGTGAGDAKLMGAVGGFLGPKGAFFAFLFSALVGGIYALILIAIHGNLRVSLERYRLMVRGLLLTGQWNYVPPGESERKPRLRYGVAIALGTVLSVLWKGGVFIQG